MPLFSILSSQKNIIYQSRKQGYIELVEALNLISENS